ncbi:hypothetical protein AAVH_38845 [Aphelenchoides avenae]|nr:hypothetical protein AAVH_38845 [Aphelenchus avenae]
MKALILLFALVACASALCIDPGHWRQFVYAKGHAKAITYEHEETKGLRVELVYYPDNNRQNVTVLAKANADDSGFYVIAGSSQVGCYGPYRKYALRLYADAIGKHPLMFGPLEQVEVPHQYVSVDDAPVKLFEKDLEGDLRLES